MHWINAKILDFELDFTNRRFIESYFINQIPNTANDKQNDKFPNVYLATLLQTRVGLNLNFEFESAHELLMNFNFNLNSTFAKPMNLNLNLVFSKSMNLNLNLVFLKSMNLNLKIPKK